MANIHLDDKELKALLASIDHCLYEATCNTESPSADDAYALLQFRESIAPSGYQSTVANWEHAKDSITSWVKYSGSERQTKHDS